MAPLNNGYKSLALAALLASFPGNDCFITPNSPNHHGRQEYTKTELLMSAPVMIIGPMIRRMRAQNEEKNRPLATDEESAKEAPGLKIGTGVWKWPPVWPYAEDFFLRPQEEAASATQANPALAMMGGGMPDTTELIENAKKSKLDTVKYWSEDKKDVTTEIDQEAVDALKSHYSFYLRDGMSVLEIGAAENSYLPEKLKLARHVGVGLNKELMETNSALTETLVVDLGVVQDDIGVKSEELNIGLGGEDTFDAILIANTIEFLTKPREVMKTCWRLLKPGGVAIVSFVGQEDLKETFGDAQTKMWRGYNDDQHMWMAGSFFQFSAGEGWEGLKGFDISPDTLGKDANADNPLSNLLNKDNKSTKTFVVQATKGVLAQEIDDENPEESFSSMMWMTPVMEKRDKMLFTPRMARIYEHFEGQVDRQKNLKEGIRYLPQLYESLIKMDQFAFPFDLQARLAADLVSDPEFIANEEQMNALRMGLGLKRPSKEFWAQVGQLTSAMEAEDKVNLLAYIVPRFGSSDPSQEAALETFVSGLKPTIAVVKSTANTMSDSDAQLVASEILACETLRPGRSSREDFATWVSAMTEDELNELASKRKAIKEVSKNDLKAFIDQREALARKEEDEKKKFAEQVEKARKERTMFFNPETGKMEEIKNSNFFGQ